MTSHLSGYATPTMLDLTLTKDEAEYIAAFVADDAVRDDEVVRLMIGPGHSGHGLYAAHPEYPEEGAVFIKADEGVTMRAMPLTSKEKQEAFRARNAMLGMTEVRGIFLPPAMHAELKAVAEKMRRRVSATVPRHSETDGAKSEMDAE